MRILITKIICGFLLLVALGTLYPIRVLAQQSATHPITIARTDIPSSTPRTDGPIPRTTVGQARLRIGPGDLLNVAVFDVPEMAQTVRVSDLGDAAFHLIGSLHMSGLTTDEARFLIAHKLKDDNFIIDPQVSVFIVEYSTQGVSVLGEVHKPGVYTVLGNRSLLDIISEAGGTTPIAGPDITVKHLDGNTISIKMTKTSQTILADDIELLPGDKVVISRASLIYVLGEVGRPGGFLMENDGKITFLQAVAMAGGINRTASMNQSRLIRKTATGYTEIPVQVKKLLQSGADIQLQAEDIVFIPTNIIKAAVYRTVPSIVSAASSAAIYRGIP